MLTPQFGLPTFQPTLPKKKEEEKIPMTSMFPGFNQKQIEWMQQQTKDLEPMEQVKMQQKMYMDTIPLIEGQKKLEERQAQKNQIYHDALNTKDKEQKSLMMAQYRVSDFADMVREREQERLGYPIDKTDDEIVGIELGRNPEIQESFLDYLNNGNEDLLYELGLKEKPAEKVEGKAIKSQIASIGLGVSDMGALEWLNPVGQVATLTNELANKIPTLSEEEWDNFAKEKLAGFGEGIGKLPTMVVNAVPSFLKTITGIGSSMLNPVDSLAGIAVLLSTKEGKEAIKQRYGSLEGFSKTMTEDPVGLASDILTVVGGGASIAGKISSLAGFGETGVKLSALGKEITTVSNLGMDLAISQGWNKLHTLSAEGNKRATLGKVIAAPSSPLEAIKGGPKKEPINRETVDYTKESDIKVSKDMEELIQKSVSPTTVEKKGSKVYNQFNKDVVSAVDSVLQYEDKLLLPDAEGNLIQRTMDGSLRDMSDAMSQTRNEIYTQYNNLLLEAGEKGITISLDNVKNELIKTKDKLDKMVGQDSVVKYIDQQIKDIDKIKTLDLDVAQTNTQYYNKKLQSFYKNPNPNDVGNALIDGLINEGIKQELSNAIIGSSEKGGAYDILKDKYRAILNTEKEITKRANVSGRGKAKGLFDLADLYSADKVVDALVSAAAGDPVGAVKGFARASVVKGLKDMYKNLNSPDKQFQKLVEQVRVNRDKIFIPKQ